MLGCHEMMDIVEKMKTNRSMCWHTDHLFLSCALLTINPGYKPLTALPILIPKWNAASMFHICCQTSAFEGSLA